MAPLTFLYLLSISLFLQEPTAAATCPTSCPGGGPEVNFPFGLNPGGNRTGPCSYPGFGLHCSNQTQELVIDLPESGQFIVRYINYESQQIWLDDPESCLPVRLLKSFNISGTPFDSEFWYSFTFFNCSAVEAAEGGLRPIPCLSDQNYSVVASPTGFFVDSDNVLRSACRPVRTFTVPFVWYGWWDGIRLEWNEPDCRSCIRSRGVCRFKDRSTREIGCYNLPSQGGLPRTAKYGIVIGVGIPGFLSLIGLVAFVGSRVRARGRQRNFPGIELLGQSISPSPAVVITGLDGSTIESYPKTKLGESGRLPKPSDNICPICISEYEPKETLRTIPECNHYFHANCIDEWLKVNASCPLCRNSPGRSDDATPSVSSSSLSPSSLLSP